MKPSLASAAIGLALLGPASALLSARPAAALAPQSRPPRRCSSHRRAPASLRVVLHAAPDDGGDDERPNGSKPPAPASPSEGGGGGREGGWADAAYSNLSNAWGYSRSVVSNRQRRRYERRRVRHRMKLQGKADGRRPLTWAERLVLMNERIGPADAFVGNVNKGRSGGGADDVDGGGSEGGATTTFDDDEMDEDGYWGMFGRKKRRFLPSLVRQLVRVPYRALFGEYRRVEPGTLILVRHGESLWNANKTFT